MEGCVVMGPLNVFNPLEPFCIFNMHARICGSQSVTAINTELCGFK